MRNIYAFMLASTAALPLVAQASHTLLSYPYERNDASGFMTTQDVLRDDASGISIHNTSGTQKVTGIFIQALWGDHDCESNPYLDLLGPYGYGMMWSNVSFSADSTATIGGNYLYNMMFNFLTVARFDSFTAAGTPGKAGSGGSGGNWCLQLGITNVTGVNVPPLPHDIAAYSLLDYSLVGVLKIPITCTDPTADTAGGCTAVSSVTQDFPVLPS